VRSYEQAHTHQMLGIDENMILCPVCKRITNTYQPVVPATKDTENITPYVSFFSMLINITKRKPVETLQVDITKNPAGFMVKVGEFVTQQLLMLTTYRQPELFKKFDGNTSSNCVTLRDLVFVVKSAIEIVDRSAEETKAEIAQSILSLVSQFTETENVFTMNYTKLVILLMFTSALLDQKVV